MGQILHGSARTTEALRRAIQHSQASIRALARRYGINPKTIAKWKRRTTTADAPMGPKAPRSTVLSKEEEAIVVAFRKHTPLPLDDCLYALQATIPHLTRSALHRCLQRHDISRLPEIAGEKPSKKKFKTYPIGFFHIDITELRTEEGKLDTSKNPGRIGDRLIHFVRLKTEVLEWLGNRAFLILRSGCESSRRRATISSG
jgi:transposase-like protein